VNTFYCRETRRSFRASSGDNSRTNTDAGRDTTTSRITATRSSCPRAAAEWWTRVTGVYFSAAPLVPRSFHLVLLEQAHERLSPDQAAAAELRGRQLPGCNQLVEHRPADAQDCRSVHHAVGEWFERRRLNASSRGPWYVAVHVRRQGLSDAARDSVLDELFNRDGWTRQVHGPAISTSRFFRACRSFDIDFVRRHVEAGDPGFEAMWNEMGVAERLDRCRDS
jgi:hypothetical protein